jgi:hypothetical protein
MRVNILPSSQWQSITDRFYQNHSLYAEPARNPNAKAAERSGAMVTPMITAPVSTKPTTNSQPTLFQGACDELTSQGRIVSECYWHN